jgi:hypothetical protein
MFKFYRFSIYTLFIFISFNSQSATNYYKCASEQGTIFSQFPCDSSATIYEVNTITNQLAGPKIDYTQQLNELERESLLTGLQAELRSNQHKLVILERKKNQADYKQQQRLNHILEKEDKIRIAADINKKQKFLNREYKHQVITIKQRINKLQNKINRFQQPPL